MAVGIGGAGEGIGKDGGNRSSSKQGFIAGMGEDRSEAELFQRIRTRLRASVGEDIFNSWFARLELEEIVDDKAHLSVPTRFLCSATCSASSACARLMAAIRACSSGGCSKRGCSRRI